jgi:hypothetical protein
MVTKVRLLAALGALVTAVVLVRQCATPASVLLTTSSGPTSAAAAIA